MNQQEIEALYSQKQIHTVLHKAIQHELDKVLINWSLVTFFRVIQYLQTTWKPSKEKRVQELREYVAARGIDSLVVPIAAAVLHTHSTQTIQQAVGYLQAFLPETDDPFDRVQTAAELLALGARKNGLYEIRKGHPVTVVVNQWKWVDRKLSESFQWINDTMFNLPLIEPPLEVKSNDGCGYHTIREPLILGDLTLHEEPQNYSAVNILNEIEWVLVPEVLMKPEVSVKKLKNKQAHANFMKLSQDSQFVYQLLGQNKFWFCWQYDSRGRLYSHGYHLNFQGAEYKRALLNFNQYEVLT